MTINFNSYQKKIKNLSDLTEDERDLLAERYLKTLTHPVVLPLPEVMRRLENIVAPAFGVEPVKIKGRSRTGRMSYARHTVIYLCRKLTPYTLKQIGAYFKIDHTTVIHAQTKVKNIADVYPEDRERLETLIKQAEELLSLKII